MDIIASGLGWRLSKSDDPYYYILELNSRYGTVEITLKRGSERQLGYDILRTYEDLKAQGPLLEARIEP
jgi:hypothetical protein